MSSVILCCAQCGHDHNSSNGPSGCCDRHGPYLYFCGDCHDEWAAAHPERVAAVQAEVRRAHRLAYRLDCPVEHPD